MRIVVIGGTGLIGSKTLERLRNKGHDVLAAAPNTGVNTITGEGLAAALAGAQVVIDLSNPPSFEEKAVVEFFETSNRNLLAAEKVAGVQHHVALSVVGTERLGGSGYFKGKAVQETLIRNSGIPYTIVRSTQFFEFTKAIADTGAAGQATRVPTACFQPIAADNVADAVASVSLDVPLNGVVEIAGPERMRMSELVARYLKATNDPREVIGDPHALYYGYEINDATLVPGTAARIFPVRFDDWLKRSGPPRPQTPTQPIQGAAR